MIVEYIRYTVADEQRGRDLVAAYEVASESLKAAPQCLGYELTACEEDATSYILRIVWRSTEDHLQGFRRDPHFPAFFKAIGGFVKEISEMRHYRATSVNWQRE